MIFLLQLRYGSNVEQLDGVATMLPSHNLRLVQEFAHYSAVVEKRVQHKLCKFNLNFIPLFELIQIAESASVGHFLLSLEHRVDVARAQAKFVCGFLL